MLFTEPEEVYRADKLWEIKDSELLACLEPLLQKNRVLQAVEICKNHYGHKYQNMTFKEWFAVVNNLYKKTCVQN